MSLRFLLHSPQGFLIDVAWRLRQEGHDVRVYTEAAYCGKSGLGFVPLCTEWRNPADWADITVFEDNTGESAIAERMRMEGRQVIGGTAYTDRLESDRGFGQQELQAAGIPILPQHTFTNFESALRHLDEFPAAYVFKPCGVAANNKQLVYVGTSDDASDMRAVLRALQHRYVGEICEFQLQQRVTGVEVGIGAFFNGTDFMQPYCVGFEHKRLYTGDLGPMTGEMGSSMYWTAASALFDATIKRFESRLRAEKYHGYFDLNCIVNADGIHPLEFTTRFGYPTIYIQQEGIRTPLATLLRGMAGGSLVQFDADGYQAGVSIRVPPSPYNDPALQEVYSNDMPIFFNTDERHGVHIQDVWVEDNQWLVTGHDGCPLLVAAGGPSMQEAIEEAYRRVRTVTIPGMYYRTDIGARWDIDSPRLSAWGYL